MNTALHQLKPHWLHGDSYWVFGLPSESEAQVAVSMLAMALEESNTVALVRFVSSFKTTPVHVCALIPWWSDQEAEFVETDIKWAGFKLLQVRCRCAGPVRL